jgi:tRNA modification GTPase
LAISCHCQSGLDLLPEKIQEILAPDVASEMAAGALICDLRHKEALLRAREALVSFERLVQDGAPIELAAYELRLVLTFLGEITGETTTDDILERIFSRFCIGK